MMTLHWVLKKLEKNNHEPENDSKGISSVRTCPRISPRGFILVLTWMKAVPRSRCCSNSTLMSFKTP